MSKPWKTFGICLVLALVAAPVAIAVSPPTAQDLVDALKSVFGRYPGVRGAHSKGICLTGHFSPTPEAPSLSKAPQFTKSVPIIARFSLGGGDPKAPDNAQDNVRGLAMHFDLGNGTTSDLVMISAPMFFVQTPELFVELLKTLKTGDKDKINAFFQAHPESTRQNAWLTSHPVPASYAGVAYWGVHAFTFTNAAGQMQLIKYKAIPKAGELGLSPQEATQKGADFYAPELKDRLGKESVVFELVAIQGKEGDPTNDPTQRWEGEDERPTTPLGKITIESIAPDDTCNAFSFLPGNVPDGIAGPPDDPVFAARSPAYIVSLIRRKAP